MKFIYSLVLASSVAFAVTSCGEESSETTNSEETDASSESSETDESHETEEGNVTFSSDLPNEISVIKYDDTAQAFNQYYVYANYNSLYQSYRIIFLNYDKSEDSDYGSRTGDQQKIVVGLFNPTDGEFKPGKYTWKGDDNGMNLITGQVETAEGMKGCNYAGHEDEGYIDVIHVTEEEIVGTFHLIGDGFELKGSFNTQHESVN
jgi:hypothetical protein